MLFGGSISMAKSPFPPWHLSCLHFIGQLITEIGNIFLKAILANVIFMVFTINVNEIVDEVKVADNTSSFEDIFDFVKDSFGWDKHVWFWQTGSTGVFSSLPNHVSIKLTFVEECLLIPLIIVTAKIWHWAAILVLPVPA
jgi:hypothetical protein